MHAGQPCPPDHTGGKFPDRQQGGKAMLLHRLTDPFVQFGCRVPEFQHVTQHRDTGGAAPGAMHRLNGGCNRAGIGVVDIVQEHDQHGKENQDEHGADGHPVSQGDGHGDHELRLYTFLQDDREQADNGRH